MKNNAGFALEYIYDLRPAPAVHHKNMSGADSFSIGCRHQGLKPDQATVVFGPDRDVPSFQSTLLVAAGEQGESREVPITAAAWPHVMFIVGGVEEPQQRTALDEPSITSNVTYEMAYLGPGDSHIRRRRTE
jgi:hypothetical protein